MEEKDVPQDRGMYGQWHGISYALDKEGRYVLASSAGWEPANLANRQAWEALEEEAAETAARVRRGELSPLAYHMILHLMDVKVLSRYVGLSRFRVRRHLKPRAFGKLDAGTLERYAKAFGITVEQLREVP